MKEQNFKNHAQYVPGFHIGMFSITIACVVLAIIYITNGVNLLSVLILLISISLALGFVFYRAFPLKAQDRAIRAEENLRHFALTGKLLDKNLAIGQITALRFAEDPEFLELAKKAAKDNMSGKEIKQSIKTWRADRHRA